MKAKNKFSDINNYPISVEEYRQREKAYSKQWQIKFFFIAILAVMSYFLPEIIVNYFLKITVARIILQIAGVILVFAVIFLSRRLRRNMAREAGLFCPECGEIFDYWSDKKNAVTFGGICPNCKFKITDAQDREDEE